ncbi:ComF family protein [Alteribacter natronophilus]|uniref:ComF family protein n=1 Tax=Alteribacter natronophilus TaxID=2583810 RepID=UPI00110EC28D|nr:ComF family protein [Alteribacter natronophilus]TMW72370.1 ComF family protein [Alteribacter natronophilus]
MNWKDLLNETDRCLYCGNGYAEPVSWQAVLGLGEERRLCPACTDKLISIDALSSCPGCSRTGSPILCSDCRAWKEDRFWADHPFTNLSLYEYNSWMKELIARFKYRGDACLAELFTGEIARRLGSAAAEACVVPIPLSEERQYERGFNQAELLAAACRPVNILTRSGQAGKQSKRSRRERIGTADRVFRIDPVSLPDNKGFILIDDIYTTGATIRSAARVLYEGGAEAVSGLTLARA